MDHRIASARPLGRCNPMMAAAGVLAVALAAPTAFAQTPKPAPKKPPAAAPAPAAPAAPAPAPAAGQVPPLMYSPWTKMCGKGPDTGGKQVCVITKDGRLENGMPVAIAQLYEPEGGPKVLRITVPLGMQIQAGTNVYIDQAPSPQTPYKICVQYGCFSDYPVNDDIIKLLKQGKMLTIHATNIEGTVISLPLPLTDFAKAYDGPATDPKVVEEQQRKLQEELQKKAEEARKKLETVQPTPPPAKK